MSLPYKNRESVGECIYCNSTVEPLTDEHVVPYSLNGDFVLARATCEICKTEIGRVENEICGKYLRPIRTKHRYKTYNKKKRPKTFSLKIGKTKGTAIDTDVPVAIYPASLALPFFRRATILTGEPQTNKSGEVTFFTYVDTRGIDQFADKTEDRFISFTNSLSTDMFMRFIAKIAHCGLVSSAGLNGYTSFLPDLILGKSNHFFHYIGSPEKNTVHEFPQPVEISVNFRPVPDSHDYFIVVTIENLLRVPTCPTYEVVAGRCDENAFNGAPLQFCNREVIRQRTLDYSKPAPGYFHFKYTVGITDIVIKQVDQKNVFWEGNALIEMKLRSNIQKNR